MLINQSHSFGHFPICQEANGVSKESTCADNTKSYTVEHCTSIYQTRVTMLNGILSLSSFWPEVGIYFLIDI